MAANCRAVCFSGHLLRLDTVLPRCAVEIAGQQATNPTDRLTFVERRAL